MLEDFTVTTFAERLGETFGVGEGSDAVEVRLVEATPAQIGIGRGLAAVFDRLPRAATLARSCL